MSRFLALILLFVALCGDVEAYTRIDHGQVSSVSGSGGGTVSVQYNSNTGTLSYSYSYPGQSGTTFYGVWLVGTAPNQLMGGYDSSKIIFDLNSANGGSGANAITAPWIQPGTWLQLAARRQQGSETTDDIGYFLVPLPPDKMVTVSLRNTAGVPVKYRLYGGNTLLGELTLQPGEALIQSLNVPAGTGAITVFSQIEGFDFTDGSWHEVDGAVKTETLTTIPTDKQQVSGETVDPTKVVDVPTPTNVPSEPAATAASGGTVWKATPSTVDTERLDKTTYRQGVDKQVSALKDLKDAIEGTAVQQQSFDSKGDASAKSDLTASVVTALPNLLPHAPNVTLPGSTSTFAFSFTPPGLNVAKSVTIDLSMYATPIAVFKAIVRAALALWFFFMAVRAIKEAFA